MARNFSKPPSELWGIEDHAIAFDFDRLCNLRLMLYDAEIRKREAEAMKGEQEIPSMYQADQLAVH